MWFAYETKGLLKEASTKNKQISVHFDEIYIVWFDFELEPQSLQSGGLVRITI